MESRTDREDGTSPCTRDCAAGLLEGQEQAQNRPLLDLAAVFVTLIDRITQNGLHDESQGGALAVTRCVDK